MKLGRGTKKRTPTNIHSHLVSWKLEGVKEKHKNMHTYHFKMNTKRLWSDICYFL